MKVAVVGATGPCRHKNVAGISRKKFSRNRVGARGI
jgi:hypothetical protein